VLVIVEGTETGIVLPRVAQFYTRLGNEVNDIDPGFNFINGGHELGIYDFW